MLLKDWKRVQNKLALHNDSYYREGEIVIDKYFEWGFLIERREPIDEKPWIVCYEITPKGLKALKWRKIECF